MRTTKTNMLKVDGEKLYQEIKERGLVLSRICEYLGVNKSYFAGVKSRGFLSSVAVVALESRFGIPRETYIINEEDSKENNTAVVEIVKDTEFFSEENQKKLYKLVYSAVYNAMKCALNE